MTRKNSLSGLELSKSNLIHNIKQFKGLAKKGTKFSIAIKGNAYGHGQNEIAKILEPFVDYFQVDDLEELELLRKVSNKKTFVFGYVQKGDLRKIINLECILSVFSLEQLAELSAVAESSAVIQEIHLPVDAYLGREGFLLKELPEVFEKIKQSKNIKLTGIYAHFAKKQINIFYQAVNLAKKFGFNKLITHISATSGLLVYEKNKGINSLVRLGIGVYGMWPSEHIKFLYKNRMTLKPVLTWKTKVAQIKNISAGSTVGYGLTYMAYDQIKIAVIPQGYADGLDRGLSNKGEVLIAGAKCKILGRVAMNMCVVDVTHLPNLKIEDEVVILGKQGSEEIIVEEMAKKLDTINYEITTRINPLLSRVVI